MTDKELADLHPFKIMYNEDGVTAIFVQRYLEIYNEQICNTCSGILMEKHARFRDDFRTKKIETMEDQIYTIPKGQIIDTYNSTVVSQGHFDASNLTNEIAEEFLKAGVGTYLIVRKDGEAIDFESFKESKEVDAVDLPIISNKKKDETIEE